MIKLISQNITPATCIHDTTIRTNPNSMEYGLMLGKIDDMQTSSIGGGVEHQFKMDEKKHIIALDS